MTVADKVAAGASKVAAGAGKLAKAINPMDLIREIATGYTELAKVKQVEHSKRVDIAARRDVELARIEAQRTALMTYLERSFAERSESFSKLFAVVDAAVASGDTGQLATAVSGIVSLAETSPFASLSNLEKTRAALADPSTVWDL